MIPRSRAKVLLVGLGGLGCPVAIVLARAGVGTLLVADDDVVDSSNLHRQILFHDADVGRDKCAAGAQRLGEHAPSVDVQFVGGRFLPHNARELAQSVDLVVEGSDNFATKMLAADACFLASRPIVHGAAVRFYGTAMAVGPGGGPCYRCLFEDLPEGNPPNCAEAGVMGPVVGVVGAYQAELALRVLDGLDTEGTLIVFDGKAETVRERKLSARTSCPLCGPRRSIFDLEMRRYLGGACASEASYAL